LSTLGRVRTVERYLLDLMDELLRRAFLQYPQLPVLWSQKGGSHNIAWNVTPHAVRRRAALIAIVLFFVILFGLPRGEIEIRQRSDLDRARRIAYILSQAASTKSEL
jgi:hypothetical protein